jgi:hypothetical protein
MDNMSGGAVILSRAVQDTDGLQKIGNDAVTYITSMKGIGSVTKTTMATGMIAMATMEIVGTTITATIVDPLNLH